MSRNRKGRRQSQAPLNREETANVIGNDRDRPFTVSHEGKVYRLPPPREGATKIKAGVMIDAVEQGTEQAGIRLGIAMLNASGADPAAMAALRDKTSEQFSKILAKWMRSGGVADLGK